MELEGSFISPASLAQSPQPEVCSQPDPNTLHCSWEAAGTQGDSGHLHRGQTTCFPLASESC